MQFQIPRIICNYEKTLPHFSTYFPCKHDVIKDSHIYTSAVFSNLLLIITNVQWRRLVAVYFPLVFLIFEIRVIAAVVTSWNDVLRLEATLRVDGGDVTDNWPRRANSSLLFERATIGRFKTLKTDLLATFESTLFSVCCVFFFSLLLIKSFIGSNKVSAQKKRQQNKRLLRQLSEPDTDFSIGQNNHENQLEDETNTEKKETPFYITQTTLVKLMAKKCTCTHSSKIFADKVRSEVGSVMTTVENRVKDAVLIA